MRAPHRRTTLIVLAAALLVGPSAVLTGNAAECAGRTIGRDGWTRVAKESIRTTAPRFSARRMVIEYIHRLYRNAAAGRGLTE